MLSLTVTGFALARLRLALADLVPGFALALTDAALLAVTKLKVGNIDPRQGNRHLLLPLAGDEVARRDKAAQLLLDLTADDLTEPV